MQPRAREGPRETERDMDTRTLRQAPAPSHAGTSCPHAVVVVPADPYLSFSTCGRMQHPDAAHDAAHDAAYGAAYGVDDRRAGCVPPVPASPERNASGRLQQQSPVGKSMCLVVSYEMQMTDSGVRKTQGIKVSGSKAFLPEPICRLPGRPASGRRVRVQAGVRRKAG